MNIRLFHESDLSQLRAIHEKFYKTEFELGELLDRNTINSFIVENSDGIITYGANRFILEMVAATNKDFSARVRREALISLLQASMFSAGRNGFDQLHCFVQDDVWKEHLLEYGFIETKGKSLVIGV